MVATFNTICPTYLGIILAVESGFTVQLVANHVIMLVIGQFVKLLETAVTATKYGCCWYVFSRTLLSVLVLRTSIVRCGRVVVLPRNWKKSQAIIAVRNNSVHSVPLDCLARCATLHRSVPEW